MLDVAYIKASPCHLPATDPFISIRVVVQVSVVVCEIMTVVCGIMTYLIVRTGKVSGY